MHTVCHSMKIVESEQKSKEPYHRKNPYRARFISCKRLNKQGSTKETLHVVLDLEDSGITYKVGSSFGIYPENSPTAVEEIISLLNVDPLTPIFDKRKEITMPLHIFLRDHANLSQTTSQHLKAVDPLHPHLTDKEALKKFVENNNLATFLSDFWNKELSIQALCDALPPLLPRYYSIASSPCKVGTELHFLVASFSYMHAGRLAHSVTAKHFRDHCVEKESFVRLFLQDNPNFTLPEDKNTPVIMIGPGTGLAAFRGFLQEREIANASKNWLFTGDRERKYDFYYEDELLSLVDQGLLRLSPAFSRDGPKKVYVQDRMFEEGKDLWHWIAKENASLYISGDAKSMAKDVQQALIDIGVQHGSLSPEASKEFFKELRFTKKLFLDVY